MLKKLQSVTKNPKLMKLFALCMCIVLGCTMLSVFAAAEGEIVADLSPEEAATDIFETLYSLITIQTIVNVIGIALAAAIGIFLAWWAIRKVTRMVIQAFSKGKISV